MINGNRTSCHPYSCLSKSDSRARSHPILFITWMITHWIGLHSVQLPYDYLWLLLLLLFCFFFQRLNTANEEIIEVLLSKQQVSLASFMINFFQIIAFDVFLFLTWPFHFVSFLLIILSPFVAFTCSTLHSSHWCRGLCLTKEVLRSCNESRGSHAFLHWYVWFCWT